MIQPSLYSVPLFTGRTLAAGDQETRAPSEGAPGPEDSRGKRASTDTTGAGGRNHRPGWWAKCGAGGAGSQGEAQVPGTRAAEAGVGNADREDWVEGQRRNLCGSCCVLVPGGQQGGVVWGFGRLGSGALSLGASPPRAYMPRPGSGPTLPGGGWKKETGVTEEGHVAR